MVARSTVIILLCALLPQLLAGQSVQANQKLRYYPVHSVISPVRQIVTALGDRVQKQGNERVIMTGTLNRQSVVSNIQCATGVVKDEIVTSNRNLTTHNEYDRYGRLTSRTSGSGSPSPVTTTTEDSDQARQVHVVTAGRLGRVLPYFNQLGELFRESENPDDATGAIAVGSTHDIRTLSAQRTVPSTPSYSLTSNPFLSDGSASEPTLGWTLRRTDTAGRTTDIYYYRGSAKPAPFGNNSNPPTHESYAYVGATRRSPTRSTRSGPLRWMRSDGCRPPRKAGCPRPRMATTPWTISDGEDDRLCQLWRVEDADAHFHLQHLGERDVHVVAGGEGTITAQGLYTAPASFTEGQQVTITAKDVGNPLRRQIAEVTLRHQ